MNFFSFKLLIHYLVLTFYCSKRLFAIEEAKAEKTAIELIKKGVDKQFLIDHNVKAENIGSTQAVRRKQIVNVLIEQNRLKEKEL
jgi:hypothetical protein